MKEAGADYVVASIQQALQQMEQLLAPGGKSNVPAAQLAAVS